ncbi:MAG TPA: reactive intermediate/imine deaminase [Candidatus Hydrogenedentes bacterium]|nr:reactive intermediate/imine deaminase [Candidatus Hydrogenedentota bacterium]
MTKECIFSHSGPPAAGPYSHAVKTNGFLFVSGQGPFARDGSGPIRGTIEEETRTTLENLKAVLADAGAGLEDVVKTTAFLSDMVNFAKFNDVYKAYFGSNQPARTCIQAGRLPLDIQVEIEAIAVIPEGK